MKSPTACRVLAFMLLHRRKPIQPREFAEAIWSGEALDRQNPAKNLKHHICNLRKLFAMISSYDLIETTRYGYALNPRLHIMTDLEFFDQYVEAAHDTTSIIRKIDFLKKAIALYKGDILSSYANEHWLIGPSAHYQMRYLATQEELLHTLAQVKDYSDLHTCASHALQVNPNNLCALYWLIVSTYHRGAKSSAKELLKEAEMNLSSSEYEELKHNLKKRDGLPWFYRELASQK